MNDFKELGFRIGQFSDLPEQLKKELQISTKMDNFDSKVISVINTMYKGMATLDEVLVGLYRKLGIIKTRQYMTNRLYRMMQSGVLYSVKGKKGAYCTKEELIEFFKKNQEIQTGE